MDMSRYVLLLKLEHPTQIPQSPEAVAAVPFQHFLCNLLTAVHSLAVPNAFCFMLPTIKSNTQIDRQVLKPLCFNYRLSLV